MSGWWAGLIAPSLAASRSMLYFGYSELTDNIAELFHSMFIYQLRSLHVPIPGTLCFGKLINFVNSSPLTGVVNKLNILLNG